eukprot:scaffold90508_cov28-Tisochrysis_lutea.AAC.2
METGLALERALLRQGAIKSRMAVGVPLPQVLASRGWTADRTSQDSRARLRRADCLGQAYSAHRVRAWHQTTRPPSLRGGQMRCAKRQSARSSRQARRSSHARTGRRRDTCTRARTWSQAPGTA